MDAKLTKAEEAGKVAVSSRMPVEKLVQIQVLVDRGNTDQQIMDISGLPLSDIQEIITVEGWRNNVLLTPEQAVVALENRNVLLKRWERPSDGGGRKDAARLQGCGARHEADG